MTTKQSTEAAPVKAIGNTEKTIKRALELSGHSLRFVGEAGRILEQMEEFWNNGTPIHPGSLLAIEFQEWGKRVMQGPMPKDLAPALLAERDALLKACILLSSRLSCDDAAQPIAKAAISAALAQKGGV